MADVYLGLGGNLGEPLMMIPQVIAALERMPGNSSVKASRFYRTKPVGGPGGQPDYINAVIAFDCELDPRDLLKKCLSLEQTFGRVRRERWGSRIIDIDILLYGDLQVNDPGLVIPHPMLRQRLFVMVPMSDVAPKNLVLPPDGRLFSKICSEARANPDFAGQMPIVAIGTE